MLPEPSKYSPPFRDKTGQAKDQGCEARREDFEKVVERKRAGRRRGLCDKGLCASWGAFSEAAGYLGDVRQRMMSYICL